MKISCVRFLSSAGTITSMEKEFISCQRRFRRSFTHTIKTVSFGNGRNELWDLNGSRV